MSVLGPGSEVEGRFRIIERRGAGSMGVVFRAEDIWLGRAVAIKMVDTAYAGDATTEKYFVQEARSLAQIRHENIVHVYSFGKHDSTYYFAMEYIDGISLDVIIEEHASRGETVDLGKANQILKAIGAGLGAVHARKLIHRDVKPANIVIEQDTGRPVLVDFGLARKTKSSNPRMTMTSGTPSYMPPEQARDTDGTRTTAASDLYAFACTAYELFTGRAVFEGEDIYEVLLAHMNEAPETISTHRPELVGLDGVFARALAKSPEHRHPSCALFLEEIDAVIREVVAPRSSLRPPLRPQSTRTPGADAIRLFLLESDEGLARQITRTADRVLDVPAIELFTGATDLVSAFERFPAEIIVLDEDALTSPATTVINALRNMQRGSDVEIIVLSRSWQSQSMPPPPPPPPGSPQAQQQQQQRDRAPSFPNLEPGSTVSGIVALGARELPKPINMQVLGSVLRSAGLRSRSSRPPVLP